MSSVSAPRGRSARLALCEVPGDPGIAAPWLGSLLALGARVSRFARGLSGRQLVVAITVPRRDFAAVLISCGWVLTSDSPSLDQPLTTLRNLQPGDPVRIVSGKHIVADFFWALDEEAEPPRARFGGVARSIDSIRAVVALEDLEEPRRSRRPEPGSVERMARMDRDWDARLAMPAADLALVGTMTWLEEDMQVALAHEAAPSDSTPMRSLLLPWNPKAATWYTHTFSSARLPESLPLPRGINAAILDGNGATKFVAEIEAPVVICVLDRSVADETASELLVQLRNTRGEPLSLATDLGWPVPHGVEALGFTVPL